MSDELLQEFSKTRSEKAFAELVRRYAGLVYSVARRRMGNATLAEDITQLVFIRFANTMPKIENQAELMGWLHRTTVNISIDTWRSETRRRAREEQAVIMNSNTDRVWETISHDLDEALNQLKDEERQTILLRFFSGKNLREVGAVLGISEAAAKMRMTRALDRLRTQLSRSGTVCTAVMLAALLEAHSVGAAPAQLISRLASMHLPAVAGGGGLFGMLMRATTLKHAAGAVLVAFIAIGLFYLLAASDSARPGRSVPTPEVTGIEFSAAQDREPSEPISHTPLAAEPTKPVRIAFHVLDAESGRGLPGARIRYAYFNSGGEGESHHIVTDSKGDASILEPDDPTKRGPNVFVVLEGYVPKVVGFRNDLSNTEYTMALEQALTIGGLVVDEDGYPVSDVAINVQGRGNKPGQMENIDFQTAIVTSRQDGSWSYGYIPKEFTDSIRLILKKPGYSVTHPIIPVPQVDVTKLVLVLERGFTIMGQVADSRGTPIRNAQIKTLNGRNERQSTHSDEQGFFALHGISPSLTGLRLKEQPVQTNEAGGFIVRGLAPSPSNAPAPETLAGLQDRIRKSRLELVRLQALAERPEEVSDLLSIKTSIEAENLLLAHVQQAIADMTKDTKTPVSLKVDLAIQADGFAAQIVNVEMTGATNTPHITLLPGNRLFGTVVDDQGNPVPDVLIRTDMDFERQIATQFDWKTRTDASGSFEWDSAPAQPVCYWFSAPRYKSIRGLSLPADGTAHRIVLTSTGTK